jgi:hypothetical protein
MDMDFLITSENMIINGTGKLLDKGRIVNERCSVKKTRVCLKGN